MNGRKLYSMIPFKEECFPDIFLFCAGDYGVLSESYRKKVRGEEMRGRVLPCGLFQLMK